MKEKNLTYENAYAELQKILSELQQSETSVEELTQKIKKASELISFCKTKLRSTESEIQKLLKDSDD